MSTKRYRSAAADRTKWSSVRHAISSRCMVSYEIFRLMDEWRNVFVFRQRIPVTVAGRRTASRT